jgi:hypothetical protein
MNKRTANIANSLFDEYEILFFFIDCILSRIYQELHYKNHIICDTGPVSSTG